MAGNAVNSGGQSIGAGIALSAQVPDLFPEIAQLSAQKQQRQEARAAADKAHAQKIKDLQLEDFVKDYGMSDAMRGKLDPTYYGTADKVSQNFILDAYNLMDKSTSDDWKYKLPELAMKANRQFQGLYDASAPFLANRAKAATDPNNMSESDKKVNFVLENAHGDPELRDDGLSALQASDPKHRFVFKPQMGDTPGAYKSLFPNSGQDMNAVTKTAFTDKDLDPATAIGAAYQLKDEQGNPVGNEYFQNTRQSVNPNKINAKAQELASNPHYKGAYFDWYAGDGAGSYGYDAQGNKIPEQWKQDANGRSTINDDPNVIHQAWTDHVKGMVDINAPNHYQTEKSSKEAADKFYAHQAYLAAHKDEGTALPKQSGDINYNGSAIAGNTSKKGFSQNSEDIRQLSPVSISVASKTQGFDDNGDATEVSLGNTTKTGQTAVQWVYKAGNDKNSKVTILSKEQIEAKNNGDKAYANAFPILLAQTDTPIGEGDNTKDPDDHTSTSEHETKYKKNWVPVNHLVDYMIGTKDAKVNAINRATLEEQNKTVEAYYNSLSPEAKKEYDANYRVNLGKKSTSKSTDETSNVDNSYQE